MSKIIRNRFNLGRFDNCRYWLGYFHGQWFDKYTNGEDIDDICYVQLNIVQSGFYKLSA